jgi:hypothetical protein
MPHSTGTIAGQTLNSIKNVEISTPKLNAEHEIPGGTSIVQVLGSKRTILKVHGILTPASEITAVATIASQPNGTIVTGSLIIGGQQYLGGGGWCIESVDWTTLAGVDTAQPWGGYTITLKNVG